MNMKNLFMELYTEKYGTKITRELAENIVVDFPITDGSTDRADGEKWNYEEAKAMAERVGVSWEDVSKCEWYVILNHMYAQHGRTGKKHGVPDTWYGELAYDWFYAVDAEPDKTFQFFIHI